MNPEKTSIKGGKRTIAAAAGLLLGTAAFLIFFLRIRGHWDELRDSIASVRPEMLKIAIIFIAFMYFLRIMRWKLLLATFGRAGWKDVTHALFIGLLANNLMPARAGEFIRPYIIKKRCGFSFNQALASVVMDRISDIAGLLTLILIMVLLFSLNSGDQPVPAQLFRHVRFRMIYPAAAVAGLAAICILIVFQPGSLFSAGKYFLNFVPASLRNPLLDFMDSVLKSAEAFSNRKSGMLILILSSGAWLSQGASTFFIAAGLGLHIGPAGALLATAAVCLAIILPQAPGYLGTYHLAASLSLEMLDIASGPAAAFALLMWGINILPVTFLGLLSIIISSTMEKNV